MQELKPEDVARIIFGAREMNAGAEIFTNVEEQETAPGGREVVDEERIERERHSEHEHDPGYRELQAVIRNLGVEAQCELIALTWLGRGDGTTDDWAELLDLARDRRSNHTAAYLLEMPLLAEYLSDGLDAFGHDIEDFEEGE